MHGAWAPLRLRVSRSVDGTGLDLDLTYRRLRLRVSRSVNGTGLDLDLTYRRLAIFVVNSVLSSPHRRSP